MRQKRPVRPMLATLVSILNACILPLGFIAQYAIAAWHEHQGYLYLHRSSADAVHEVLSPFAYILAAGIAVALWQMHRSSAYLALGRAALIAAELAVSLADHEHPRLTAINLLVALLIAAYCFYATNPSRLLYAPSARRRKRRRSSSSTTAPQPQTTTQPLTTSQFYLSDHEDHILPVASDADPKPDPTHST